MKRFLLIATGFVTVFVLLYNCNTNPLPEREFIKIYNAEKAYNELKNTTLAELIEKYDDINTPNEALEMKNREMENYKSEYVKGMQKLTSRQRHAYYERKKARERRALKQSNLRKQLENDLK